LRWLDAHRSSGLSSCHAPANIFALRHGEKPAANAGCSRREVVVHSFSRFFRDHFELEFYVRKPAKNGVELVSITQELGDDPMHVMMRHTGCERSAGNIGGYHAIILSG
jgi:hypothetical protein